MLKHVRDEKGNYYIADEQNAPRHALCAMCNAPVLLRTSKLGNRYYALFPGANHEYDECSGLEEKNLILDLNRTDPGKFLSRFFSDSFSEPEVESGDDKESGNGGKFGGKPTGPASERVVGMSSLKHLVATGHLDCPDRPMQDGHWLSDLTINPPASYLLLGLPDLGRRILQGRPQMFDDRHQIIFLKQYIKYDVLHTDVNRFVVLALFFDDSTVYKQAKNLMFEKYRDEATNEIRYRRRYERVAIVADWIPIRQNDCICPLSCDASGWKCEGMYKGKIYRIPWVFPIPHSRIRYQKDK